MSIGTTCCYQSEGAPSKFFCGVSDPSLNQDGGSLMPKHGLVSGHNAKSGDNAMRLIMIT